MVDFTDEDDALLGELGVEVEIKKTASRTPKEERIIAGFEEIQKFVEEHGRQPMHGEDRDIFERLYAVRLDQLRSQQDCRELLAELDHHKLLIGQSSDITDISNISDDELLAELGIEVDATTNVTELKHVKPRAEIRAAEEIANRIKCDGFEKFKPLFDRVREELDVGIRETRKYVKDAGFLKAEVKIGQFFILGGQTVYVADIGEAIKAPNNESDARLKLIYSNGTESNLLLRSLQRALYKDEAGRRITEPSAGPLFGAEQEAEEIESGTIYVLRSKSDHSDIAPHRDILHKIGVTGSKIETRIANAKLDPTFLMADVEIVATYELFNINRVKLEKLIHRFFSTARLDLVITDRFGNPIKPREWFLVPLSAIDSAVQKIQDGTISEVEYDPASARLRKLDL